jgi:mono/diheme cytochrome c family protein
LLLWAATAWAVGAAAPAVARGASSPVFDQHCIACHGPDARGIENLGVDLVESAFVRRSTSAELITFLRSGRLIDHPATLTGRPMPGFGWLTDGELEALAEFLKAQAGP